MWQGIVDLYRRLRHWFAPEHRKDAALMTVFTLVGGLLPLYGGALFIWLLLSDFSWPNLVDHGEFAIYSASLLSTALYFASREYKVDFPERATWILFTVIILVVSVFIFAAAAAAVNDEEFRTDINEVAIRVVSPILFVITLGFVFALTVRGQGLQPKEDVVATVEGLQEERLSELDEEFSQLPEEERREIDE